MGIYHSLYTGHFDVVFLFSIFSVENKQPPHFVGYSRRKKTRQSRPVERGSKPAPQPPIATG
jgi:hypothetical protein